MRVSITSLIILILLAGFSTAWETATYDYICLESVLHVWDAETFMDCLGDNSVDFVNILSNQSENLLDYTKCPIKVQPHAKYLCSNQTDSPANTSARYFFELALNSTTTCNRVRNFCIGTAYFAETYFPTQGVIIESENGCEEAISRGVDKKIELEDDKWQVRTVCRFKYYIPKLGRSLPTRYRQSFIITSRSIENIVEDLIQKGTLIQETPLVSTTSLTTSSLLTTSTIKLTSTTIPAKKGLSKGTISAAIVAIALVAIIISAAYLSKKKGKTHLEEKAKD